MYPSLLIKDYLPSPHTRVLSTSQHPQQVCGKDRWHLVTFLLRNTRDTVAFLRSPSGLLEPWTQNSVTDENNGAVQGDDEYHICAGLGQQLLRLGLRVPSSEVG